MTHPSEHGNWYDRTGKQVYQIRGVNGRMRPPTLRDARKLGLLPGHTAIVKQEAAPLLETWKIKQALLAAITLPRLPGESDDAFMERALEDSRAQASHARDEGKRIHAVIQGAFEGRVAADKDQIYVRAVVERLEARYGFKNWKAEQSFACSLGYGGKADLVAPGIVGDIKCKDFGEDKEGIHLAWPEHSMQLAAYADGFGIANPDCVNIFVSTRVPGLVRLREWDPQEIKDAREAFGLLLRLWKLRRNYDPSFNPETIAA